MLGLSTHAYAWRRHHDNSRPFSVLDVFDDALRLGIQLVQLCDLPELESADERWLAFVRGSAAARGLSLETGTRGVRTEHLRSHLRKARALGAPLVRSMLGDGGNAPTPGAAVERLREVLPEYEASGVVLALETYEQVSSRELVEIVEEVGSASLGICLDPGNSVARLEHPSDVIRRTAPHVVNIHVKDFAFARSEATIGFTFAGAELGTGLLDYEEMVGTVAAANPTRVVNQVVEHWLVRQASLADTCVMEKQWVDGAVAWLRLRT